MAINAPEGTRDLLPDEALFWNQFKQTAAEVFGAYGYLPIETPIMEQTELFVRGIGEATDVVSKEMFTAISGENLRRWVEEGKAPKAKSRLSLRPEGTAGVVRAVVQHDLVPQGAAIMADAPKITDHLCDECREHYDAVKVLLDGAGVVYEEDYKLVRGLDYYTRTVFEVQVDNGMGAQNAIGGGGRYDKLAEEVGAVPRRVSASRSASSAACWPWKRPAWNSRGPRSATCSWPASMIPCAPGPSRSYRNVATPASRPRWITRSAR